MLGILSLGFLLGLQHALEADHIAAVSSIAARRSEVRDIVKHGLTWGLGHTLTLFVFAGAALLAGQVISETLSRRLETAVGIMLVGLGLQLLWRLWHDRVHFHRHQHDDGTAHLHAHSHAGEQIQQRRTTHPQVPHPQASHPQASHRQASHRQVPHVRTPHAHAHGFRWRTLLVGLMHGMAGSAALLVLAMARAPSTAAGLFYIALFGIGSMLGMGALSTVIAVPIAISARGLTVVNRALQGAVGFVTIAIGVRTILETAFA